MKILFFDDIYGTAGIEMFEEHLKNLKDIYRPNLIIINGENIANGRGINKEIYTKMMMHGVNAITMGNWTWANRDLLNFIDESNVIRPANYKDRKSTRLNSSHVRISYAVFCLKKTKT